MVTHGNVFPVGRPRGRIATVHTAFLGYEQEIAGREDLERV
jgi:hypothetical protein